MSARSVSRHSHSHKGSQNGLQHMTAAMKSELLECSVSGVPFSADASSPHAPFVLKCGHTFARATIERFMRKDACCPIDGYALHSDCINDYRPNYGLMNIVAALDRNVADMYRLPAGKIIYSTNESSFLGEGGSGQVFLGTLNLDGFDEQVAVKILSLRNAQPQHVLLARRELELMCTVSQRLAGSVIELKGFYERPGRELVLAMELADSSLQDWQRLQPGGRLSYAQWMSTSIQVAEALSRLHRLNVIHRDVSGGNIMRSRAGVMKLADFGISRMCDHTLRITNGTTMQGNIPYMSPEQGDPEATTTDRSDVWSFAATMLEAWTGEIPYEGLNQYQIMRQHMQGIPPRLECAARPWPPELQELMRQCFSMKPVMRPSAAELVVRLCALKKHLAKLFDKENSAEPSLMAQSLDGISGGAPLEFLSVPTIDQLPEPAGASLRLNGLPCGHASSPGNTVVAPPYHSSAGSNGSRSGSVDCRGGSNGTLNRRVSPAVTPIAPPTPQERAVPEIEYAQRHRFILDSTASGRGGSALSNGFGSVNPAYSAQSATSSSTRPGVHDLLSSAQSGASGGPYAHLPHFGSFSRSHGGSSQAGGTMAASAAGDGGRGPTYPRAFLAAHLRDPANFPPPVPCTHAPLLVLLQHYDGAALPRGLPYYCAEGTVGGLEEVMLQAPPDSQYATAAQRAANALSLPDSDLGLLARHLAGAPDFRALTLARCSLRSPALCTLVIKLPRLRRLTVYNCGLDAAAFCAMLAVLPSDLVALNAGGNSLGKIASAMSRLKSILESGSMRGGLRSSASNGSNNGGGGDVDLSPIGRLIALQELRLRRAGLTGAAAQQLAPHLRPLSALHAVDFSFNPLGKRGTRALCAALSASGAPINEIRLDSVKSPNAGLSGGLHNILGELKGHLARTLHVLALSSCSIDSAGATAVAAFCQRAPQLRVLDVSRNSIGARGATAIASALAQAKQVREINLGHNDIGNIGAGTALEFLSGCPMLEVLDLEATGMSGAVVPAFVKVMARFESLAELRLGWNSLMDDAIKALVAVLHRAPNLYALHLPSTGLQWNGVQAVVAAARSNDSLKVLDVQFNAPGGGGHALLEQLVAERPDMEVRRW